ncbi:MAG: capsular biosynthesis protein, partial [Cyclobacteriaceae bacterium]
MSEKFSSLEENLLVESQPNQSLPVNFKRILDRAIRYWYLIFLSLLAAMSIAFLINRYSTRIYTVVASIIVREGNENAAAEFLYKNNPLINPYRNFINELYIMKSSPLIHEVIEELNYDVSWYREGKVKTTEVYDSDFPVKFTVLRTGDRPTGRKLIFEITSAESFALSFYNEDQSYGKSFENLAFNDTLAINGFRFYVKLRRPLQPDMMNIKYLIVFNDTYRLTNSYSARLSAQWAEQGGSVINLSINGSLPEKEIDFLEKFIERYQKYDLDKKNQAATRSIEFLDLQLANIGDSLSYFDNQVEVFKKDQLFTDFDAESSRLLERLEKLESQRTQLVLQDNYFRYLDEYIKRGKDFDQIVPPTALGITDNVLTEIITQLTEMQFGLRMLGDQKSETNPLVVERRQAIQLLKNDILEGVNARS